MAEYIAVKCHALKSRLLPMHMIQSLSLAEDVRGMMDLLLPTDYGADISKLTKADAHMLERVFRKKLVERYNLLKVSFRGFVGSPLWRIYGEGLWGVESPPEDLWGLVGTYGRRLEVQNVIRILRGKFSKTPNERIEETLFPLGKLCTINFDNLLKADSVDVAVEMLKNTVYSPLTEALRLSYESKSILPMEMQIWSIYYGYLVDALSSIPEDEREGVKHIVGTEIDATNTLICTASITYGYNKEFVTKLIIPYSFKVSVNNFKTATQVDNADALKSLLSPYAKIIDYAIKGDDVSAQVELYRYLRKEAQKQLSRESHHAYVLSYMLLCEIEYRDLALIALAKQYRVKSDELKTILKA